MPTPVTQGEYAAYANATGRPAAQCRIRTAVITVKARTWKAPGFAQSPDHPVVCLAETDAQAYAAETFNFLYTERTQTLEWPTWVVNLILPIFALTLIVHNTANLLEDLGLARKREQVSLTSAEGAA